MRKLISIKTEWTLYFFNWVPDAQCPNTKIYSKKCLVNMHILRISQHHWISHQSLAISLLCSNFFFFGFISSCHSAIIPIPKCDVLTQQPYNFFPIHLFIFAPPNVKHPIAKSLLLHIRSNRTAQKSWEYTQYYVCIVFIVAAYDRNRCRCVCSPNTYSIYDTQKSQVCTNCKTYSKYLLGFIPYTDPKQSHFLSHFPSFPFSLIFSFIFVYYFLSFLCDTRSLAPFDFTPKSKRHRQQKPKTTTTTTSRAKVSLGSVRSLRQTKTKWKGKKKREKLC